MNSHNPAHPASSSNNNTIPFPNKVAAPRAASKLEQLVVLESGIRLLPGRSALAIHAVNEPRLLLGFEQAFMMALSRQGKARIEAASSLADVEAHAPLVRELCLTVRGNACADKAVQISLTGLGKAHGYPHPFGLWLPLLDRYGRAFAGLLLTRSSPWQVADVQIGERVAGSYALSLRALSPPSLLGWFTVPRWLLLTSAVVVAGLAMVPVKLSVLAPFEVVAADPHIVAAPLDGVIAHIDAQPNARVHKGQVLFRLEDTVLMAEADIARQKADVAASKFTTAEIGAFSDQDLHRTVAIAAKERDLAEAEHKYAKAMLARAEVLAESDGVLIYSSPSEWIGKPVQVGERVMEIADPLRVDFRIDLGVGDAIALEQGNSVRLFLDAEPLRPRDAKIHELSFHATPQADGTLSYRVIAQANDSNAPARIGFRGTAQVTGRDVSLGFYLLRRPIAAFRQMFGI